MQELIFTLLRRYKCFFLEKTENNAKNLILSVKKKLIWRKSEYKYRENKVISRNLCNLISWRETFNDF